MKTLFKTFVSYNQGSYGDLVLYFNDGNHGDLLLSIDGKCVWSSASLAKLTQTIDGTGWAEAAFDEPDRRQHFGVGSGGAGRTGGGGVSPDAAVIHGTSGRGFWDPSLLNIET